MRRRPRTRIISAVLFLIPMFELITEDLMDLFSPGTDVHLALSSLPPHPLFHVLTPSVGFFTAAAISASASALAPT